MKVNKQAKRLFRKPQLRQQLSGIYRVHILHGLDFHDNSLLNEQVNSVATVEFNAFIDQRDGYLSLDPKPVKFDFSGQAGLVSRFEQARPQRAVNLDGGADDTPA